MGTIKWDEYVRHALQALPDHKYLALVNTYLLGRNISSNEWVDPFAPDIPEEQIANVYTKREGIEKTVLQPGFTIILGEHGIGKSTLLHSYKFTFETIRQDSQARPYTLNIPASISRIRAVLPSESLHTGKESILTAQRTAILVFQAFWETFITGRLSSEYLGTLRKRRDWMIELRNFYKIYASQTCLVEDFELEAWLKAGDPPISLSIEETSEAQLRRLLEFITKHPALKDIFGEPWLYPKVCLLVDGIEHLSGLDAQRLIQDAQQIYHSHWEYLDLKLFVDAHYEEIITQFPLVQDDRIPVYRLPSWTRSELHELTENRLNAYLPDGDPAPESPDYWSSKLSSLVQVDFFALILNEAPEQRPSPFPLSNSDSEAQSASRKQHPTPLQILQLTRLLLAATAGSFLSDKPKLKRKDLKEITDAYWKTVKTHTSEETDGK